MKRSVLMILALLALAGSLVACQAATQLTQQEVVRTVEVILEVTATSPPTPLPAAETSPPEEQAPTPTKTPSSMQATLEALKAQAAQSTPGSAPTRPAIAPDDYVGMFEQAWQIVDENYVRDDFNGVDWQAVHDEYRARVEQIRSQEDFWDLMEDFIGELSDDHSRFVRPSRFAVEFDLPQPGETVGRPWPGFIVWPAREDQHLLLWDVCASGPAAQAGLVRGDIILAINGQEIERPESGFDEQVVSQLLYQEEDEVLLTVQQGPGKDPRVVRLRFGGASGCDGWVYGVVSEDPYVGYIRIPDFGGNSDTLIWQMIQELEAERPLEGLILDVRHNPGGNSDAALKIFTEGTFGMVGPLREDATQTIYRIRGPVRWNQTTPMAVLIDGSSHSAAEYFATGMQQSGRAVLVGMNTAGNTEGINSFGLPDGSVIRLAWMTLQLPDGSTLEGTGVAPDIRVPLGQWGLRERPDVQLRAAFEAVLQQIR